MANSRTAASSRRPGAPRGARSEQRFKFLAWLRERGVTLADCNQHDIDQWFAGGPSTRNHARRFITFAVQRRIFGSLRVPYVKQGQPDAQPRPERIALVRRLFTDNELSVGDRVAGLLVLLYALPASRIGALPLDAVVVTGDQVLLRVAEEELPLPEPLAHLTATLAAQRRNMSTANPDSPWLFPGRLPGPPISVRQMLVRLHDIGVTRADRVSAFDELLREIPAPVPADLIGCHPGFAAERASVLATDWYSYAALRIRSPGLRHQARSGGSPRNADRRGWNCPCSGLRPWRGRRLILTRG